MSRMRALLITVLVLILLVVGADIAGRAIAESKAGEAIATQAHVSTAPDVSIHGFSFLAQALPGHYQKITVESGGIDLGPVPNVATVVDLYDVDFPLSDALDGDTTHLTAARADLRAAVPTASLATALQGQGITVSAGADGTIRLSATVKVAGRSVPVSADVTATFTGGRLHLAASAVKGAGVALPVSADVLARALSLDIPLTNLPVPITAASVSADGTGLIITAEAVNVSAAHLK